MMITNIDDIFYLVEITSFNGKHIGLEKFEKLSEATRFIDEYSDNSSYCNLLETKLLDY